MYRVLRKMCFSPVCVCGLKNGCARVRHFECSVEIAAASESPNKDNVLFQYVSKQSIVDHCLLTLGGVNPLSLIESSCCWTSL